jgi:glycerol-3-phosphate dehydrogenase subunit B
MSKAFLVFQAQGKPMADNRTSPKTVLVLGSGLAGTSAALRLASKGWKVHVVAFEVGATSLSSGSWDLGPIPLLSNPSLVEFLESHTRPRLESLWSGLEGITHFLEQLQNLLGTSGFQDLLTINEDRPYLLPTTQGLMRKSFIAQSIQSRADLAGDKRRIAVVGDPNWNYPGELLTQSWQTAQSRLSLLHEFKYVNVRVSAQLQDLETVAMQLQQDKTKRGALIDSLRGLRGEADQIWLPPICLTDDLSQEIESVVGIPVAEPLCSRETIAGRRLQMACNQSLGAAGVGVTLSEDCQLRWRSQKVIQADVLTRQKQKQSLTADEYIVATGRFIGRGFRNDANICEASVGGIPVFSDKERIWTESYPPDKAYNRLGIRVNAEFRPWISSNATAENVRATGSCIGGLDFAKEKMGLAVMAILGIGCADKVAQV